jgi:TolA-binding protein
MGARARALLERGHAGDAQAILLECLERAADDVGLRYLLGVSQFRLQRFAQAEQTFRQVISGQPDHHHAVYYLGLSLERQNRLAEADRMYRVALSLRPDFREAREKVGHVAAAGSPTENPATRPLSALIEGGDRTEQSHQTLPGELLFSGRRRLSSFAGHLVVAAALMLLSWIIAATGSPGQGSVMVPGGKGDPGYSTEGASAQSLVAEIEALTRREQELQARLDEMLRSSAPAVDQAQVRRELQDVKGQLLGKEGELRMLQFREESMRGSKEHMVRSAAPVTQAGAGLRRWAPLLLGIAAVLVLVHLALAHAGTRFEIFQRRIDMRRGGFTTASESIWHYEIRDVQLDRSPLLRLTGTARIILSTDNGQRSLVGLAPAATMERMWREIRDAVLVERREMKKMWI